MPSLVDPSISLIHLALQDINQSGDGGLYAELLPNRAFQGDRNNPASVNTLPWYPVGNAQLDLVTDDPSPLSEALAFSVKISGSNGQIGLSNNGFWGIDVQPQVYSGQFWVKGDYNGLFVAALHSNETAQGDFGTAQIQVQSTSQEWKQVEYQIQVDQRAPDSNNTFTLTFDASQAAKGLQLNLISLFPPTYNNRKNGLRVDLIENIKATNPSFLRFPGGNNLEGKGTRDGYWKWDNTIGPLKDRPGRGGVTGYYNSDGLGLDEYFALCEDLNMEPILALWAGFWLSGEAVQQTDYQLVVNDALNELEYLLGDESTPYGAQRCANGHQAPYKLQYLEIGNEDNLNSGLDTYAAYRYSLMRDAILQRYPYMIVIASTQELPSEAYGANNMADYHQYTRPDNFVNQSNFFDANTTDHPILIGEYANVQPNVDKFPNGTYQPAVVNDPANPLSPDAFWQGSVAEAVFLLGAERNAAKILGAAYAPLFKNLDAVTWPVDLIGFAADPTKTELSTSFQVFRLFSNIRFTQTRPTNVTNQPGSQGPTRSSSDGPVYWAAGENTLTGANVLKLATYNATTVGQQSIANTNRQARQTVPVTVSFDSVSGGTQARLVVLSAQDPMAMGNDAAMIRQSRVTADSEGRFSFRLPDLAVAVLETRPEHGEFVNGLAGSGGYGGCKNGQRTSYDWQEWLQGTQEGTGCQ